MRFIDLLRRHARDRLRRALGLVIVSGLFQGVTLAILNGAAFGLLQGGATALLFFVFLAAVVGSHVTTGEGLREGTALAEGTVRSIRVRLADKIRRAEVEPFEQLDEARLRSYLTTEMIQISEGALRIIASIVSACVAVFSFLYIAYLLPQAFRVTLFLIALGFGIYFANYRRLKTGLADASAREADFVAALTHLLEGFKELKIDAAKSDDFFHNRLVPSMEAVRGLSAAVRGRYAEYYVFAHACFFVALGSVVFLLPFRGESDPFVIFKIAIVILFMIGPLEGLATTVPFLERANVAADNIERLEAELDALQPEPEPSAAIEAPASSLREVRLEQATFEYSDGGSGSAFVVGPLDFSVRAGEIVFVTGGNGSGKTTFLKLLAGLYVPRSGVLTMNGGRVDPRSRPAYRERLGAIFSDFHLFDRFYGAEDVDERRVQELLNEMGLGGKTSYEHGRFTTLQLSTGQKKRLALVMCLVENRELLMFDELAADQDPAFRDYIYDVVLENLRKSGKTIVAVTHDDRYFNRADRVVTMREGKFG